LIWVRREWENFLKWGWTGQITRLSRSNKSTTFYSQAGGRVILVIDNDTTNIFDSIKKTFGMTVAPTSASAFYHLCHNLYLIKTPELGPKGTSCIEDFFDSSVLKVVVDGKTFNPAKEIDTTKEYGKIVLAEKVIRPNASTIDFKKFDGILDRIVAVMNDYKPPSTVVSVTPASSVASVAPLAKVP
jgi:hypothetical protein